MNTTHTRAQVEATIKLFVYLLTQEHNRYYAEKYPTLGVPTFRIQYGSKNAKIVRVDPGSKGGSVYCFIELESGAILKAAGWNAPAKGARGSIFNEDCDVGADKPCSVHGGGLYR